ncbi:MAG TPA: DUF1800 domain-containing protein [Chitinophagaceae bacterium]|nr:DUF1800 domain-containing protein [Chitinophagaceae bacterium]HNU13017.1 DUF1800 domain-containing protein [Chitinophagaceae bacterium]
MDRRDFFKRARKKYSTAKAGQSGARLFAGLTPYNGNWTVNEVAHLLKRTMFGARKTDIDYFLSLSPGAAVDELLNNVTVPSPPVRDYGLLEDEGVFYDDLGVAIGQTWVNDPNTASHPDVRGQINSRRVSSLKKWWSGLIINQNRSIQEKMVLFWHHHFSIQESEVSNAQILYRHHNLLRTNALGNFKTLVREVTIDPAMLIHLNGYLNSMQAPDENYARELQELFAVGKGDDSLYTEDDVIAAARVLTGWRINDNPLGSYLDTGAHDTGSKTFSAFYNNTTINGSTDPDMELDALIDMIFNTTEAARFICRKLYKWFVYYEIDDATEADVIIPMAQVLQSNNYDIRPALSILFKSEHFYDVLNQACYIKNPFDIIVGTLREFNVNFPAYTDYSTGYPLFNSIYQNAAEMQQELFQPPDVSGWPSYYQEPMHYELWVNSNSLPKRADFTDALVNDAVIDVRAFAGYSSNPSDPNQLIDDVTALLLRYPLSANSKTYVKTHFLTNNTTDDTIWTNAWNSNNNTVINTSLREMFKFLMNLPEFHLC